MIQKTGLYILALLMHVSLMLAAPPLGKIEYGNNKKVGKYASLRNFKMYYEVYGVGKPLLIIHGNGGNIGNFKYQIPYFAKNYKVIVADSRAQGKSKDEQDSLSYEMMADDLNELLNQLHTDSCYVIGWSDGGINGLLLAMRHPEKVKKLAITGANLWPDTTAVEASIYHLVKNEYEKMQSKTKTDSLKNDLKLTHLLLYEPNIKAEELRKIECPTLVIGGDHDVILPQHTLLIAENIQKSYLWLLPWSGHSTPIFRKEEFNKVISDFFRRPYNKIEGVRRFN